MRNVSARQIILLLRVFLNQATKPIKPVAVRSLSTMNQIGPRLKAMRANGISSASNVVMSPAK